MTSNREFAATTYSKTLNANAKRMHDTLAPLTITAYESRWKTFVSAQSDKKGIGAQLAAIVNDLKRKAIAKELSWSSVRLYKATVCYGITMTYLARHHANTEIYHHLKAIANFKPMKGLSFDNSLDKDFFERLYTDIKDFTLPKEEKGEATGGKTSSTKAKNLPKEIYDIIVGDAKYAGETYELLREFISINCIIGLRPVEWFDLKAMTRLQFDSNADKWFDRMSKSDVEVITDKKQRLGHESLYSGLQEVQSDASVILVKNGKNSLGRAGIEYRVLYNSDKDFYKRVNAAKQGLLEAAQKIAITKKEEGDSSFIDSTGQANVIAFNQVMKLLQKKMHYIIQTDDRIKASVIRNHKKILSRKKFTDKMSEAEFQKYKKDTPIKVPTIYSTRHQAVANAKEAGLSAVAIAAMFGHSSVITANRHYGKAASGTGGIKVRPSDRNIDSVVLGVTEDQMRLLIEKVNLVENKLKAQKPNTHTNESTPYNGFNP